MFRADTQNASLKSAFYGGHVRSKKIFDTANGLNHPIRIR
jgi:hypothetical protein